MSTPFLRAVGLENHLLRGLESPSEAAETERPGPAAHAQALPPAAGGVHHGARLVRGDGQSAGHGHQGALGPACAGGEGREAQQGHHLGGAIHLEARNGCESCWNGWCPEGKTAPRADLELLCESRGC